MTQRRFHYEQAFEHYLRANCVPYVAVDEARKALTRTTSSAGGEQEVEAIKSFDFVVYAEAASYLVDIKGRMYGSARSGTLTAGRRYESWVTQDDIDGLACWQTLFGPSFEAVFVFAYCLRQQPPDALFEEIFEFGGRWYALRSASLGDYQREMVCRSSKWRTVHVKAEAFARISRPFSVRAGRDGPGGGVTGPMA